MLLCFLDPPGAIGLSTIRRGQRKKPPTRPFGGEISSSCFTILLLLNSNLNQETEAKMTREVLENNEAGLLQSGVFLQPLQRESCDKKSVSFVCRLSVLLSAG